MSEQKLNMTDVILKLLNEYESGKVTAIKFSIDASLNNEQLEKAQEKIKSLESKLSVAKDALKFCSIENASHRETSFHAKEVLKEIEGGE